MRMDWHIQILHLGKKIKLKKKEIKQLYNWIANKDTLELNWKAVSQNIKLQKVK